MKTEKILERVRKLLAVANNEGASDAERDTALKMAYDLLAKNELDMADVEVSARDAEDPRGHYSNEGWGSPWARSIRGSMGRLFNVKYYTGQKINGTRMVHNYVGREGAATTAMYMSDWITKDVLREADKRYGHRLNPTARSFCIGVAQRLRERVDTMISAKEAEFIGQGFAMVLYNAAKREEEANEGFIKGMGVKLTFKPGRASRVNLKAFQAGQEHGDSYQLNTQINQKERKS